MDYRILESSNRSDESCFSLFLTSVWIYVCRTLYYTNYLLPGVKHGQGLCDGLGSHIVIFCEPRDNFARTHYYQELCEHSGRSSPSLGIKFVPKWWLCLPRRQSPCLQSSHRLGLDLSHHPWTPQSLDFNIIKHLWFTLDRKVRDPLSSLSELAPVYQEKWYNIHLATEVYLYSKKIANCF